MSYTTQYGKCRFDTSLKRKKLYLIPLILTLMVSLILAQIAFPSQLKQIRSAIFPFWEPEVQQSFSEMAASIRDGTGFEEAAAAFCREILSEGAY